MVTLTLVRALNPKSNVLLTVSTVPVQHQLPYLAQVLPTLRQLNINKNTDNKN